MTEESKHGRRHFLRNAAITIAAVEFGMRGFVNAQSTKSLRSSKESRR